MSKKNNMELSESEEKPVVVPDNAEKTDAKIIEKIIPEKGEELMAKAKKIGVVRYLQDYPQESYIETLMKKKYAMQAKTIEEWNEIAIAVAKIRY